ncbi:hypothetical protein HYALB_00008245 [Hymenoscyphus albidus]|uniref:Uncharacterized protein n=1 Tax=Hymenoscyphus albidus TaxID=595503 RepID=A0A9N9LNZ2_9HELO|nr:hypothetical protein HYALB_00008245 [Hymenoscyphus albidus]
MNLVANGPEDASTWHKVRIPINPARAYLPIAIGNPALLHVTLLHAAMNSPFLRDPKFQTALNYHKWKSIEAVNESIRKSTFDTFTIATVALLALLESADGSEIACRAHMTGLRALATHVGELDIDTLNPLLRQTIGWIDVAGAMTLQSPLLFTNTSDFIWNDVSFQTKMMVQVKHIVAKLYLITGSRALSESSGNIFQHLKWLSNGISRIPTSDVAGLEKLDFHTRLDHIERQCIELRNRALESANGNVDLIIAFSNASLIYICLIVRGYQRRLGMFEVLSQRTRNAIESMDWLMVDDTIPEMLLWITMVTSLALGEGAQKRWFSKSVKSVGGSMRLSTATEIAEKVKSFLWVENFVSREGLWQDGVDGCIEMEGI